MIYVRLLLFFVACGLSGWLGYRVADGAAAKRELVVATAYADWGKSAIEGVRAQLKAEGRRAVLAAEARGRKAALSQGVIADAAQDLDRSCEWRSPHRLRIESVYSAYGVPTGTRAVGMRATLPTAPADDTSARAVGAGDPAVGVGVQGSAR